MLTPQISLHYVDQTVRPEVIDYHGDSDNFDSFNRAWGLKAKPDFDENLKIGLEWMFSVWTLDGDWIYLRI